MPKATPQPSDTIRPAGREIELWNDEHFSKLRKAAGVPDDFLNEGWGYEKLQKGGGKGGTLMAFLWGKYIVKEMSTGDHEAMMEITEEYVNHIVEGQSKLCVVFLHYRDVADDKIYFAMRNEVGNGPFKALYDLKGCADDKTLETNGKPREAIHKRIWNCSLWCGKCRWNHERHAYFNGKKDAAKLNLPMTEEQRTQLMKEISYDTQWLAEKNLMDYSLLVAVRSEAPTNGTESCLRVFDNNGSEAFLCISIIDFLQKWTCGKRVARALKVFECNKATVPPGIYGKRFERHFGKVFTVASIAPESFAEEPLHERV